MEDFDTIQDFLNSISPDFIPFLRDGGYVVAGSCAMYFMMKQNGLDVKDFKPRDIDVFGKFRDGFKDKLTFAENFCETTGCSYSMKVGEIENVFKATSKISDDKHWFIDFVNISKNYEGNILIYIQEEFDLDFCKCWFDGEELHGPLAMLNYKLCVISQESFEKYMKKLTLEPIDLLQHLCELRDHQKNYLKFSDDKMNLFDRILKYGERGFEVITSHLVIPKEIIEACINERVYQTNLLLGNKQEVSVVHYHGNIESQIV